MKINPALRGTLTIVAEGRVSSAEISSDGSTVVYNEFDGENTFVARHRDGDSVKLTHDGHPSMHPDVSGDGRTVVYTRFSEADSTRPGNWDVYRWRENHGSDPIADGPGNEMSPRVSDDGRVIVWDDDVDGVLGGNNIGKWVDGQSGPVLASESSDLFPNLSGDGTRLVWRRFSEGKTTVWIQDQNGVVKPFLEREGNIVRPVLSGDGRELIYADQSAGDADLVFHDESRGTDRIVAGERKVEETWGSLSGDSSTIAWTALDFRQGAPARTNIFLEKDGRVLQLTDDEEGLNTEPRLDEDGDTIVWSWMSRKDTNDRRIYKLEIEGIDEQSSESPASVT